MSVAAQKSKIVAVVQPVAIVDDASYTTVEVDTRGFDYAVFYFMVGATDIAMVAAKLQESDVSGSGMADVVGARFGTDDNTGGSTSTLPSATDDDKVFAIEVDLRGRKRYLDMVLTAGNGSLGMFLAGWCELSRAHDMPVTAAERGCSQILRV